MPTRTYLRGVLCDAAHSTGEVVHVVTEAVQLAALGVTADAHHGLRQYACALHDAVETGEVRLLADRLGRVLQQRAHRLDLTQRVVALLLTWRRRRADVHQVTDALRHFPV